MNTTDDCTTWAMLTIHGWRTCTAREAADACVAGAVVRLEGGGE
jgi:hypothetical protein